MHVHKSPGSTSAIPHSCIKHMRHVSYWLIGVAASAGNLFTLHSTAYHTSVLRLNRTKYNYRKA
jgi:hypothetical protein